MELKETTVSQKTVYDGLVVKIRVDEVTLQDGSPARREVIEHPGAVAVFPMDDEGNVILVRQFRYAVGEPVLELPAGKLEPGEDPYDSALRELEEETGLQPKTVIPMGMCYSSPGILGERLYLYFAKDLVQADSHPDEGEFVEIVRMPYGELMDLARQGEIKDGKTLAGLFKASLLLEEGK